MIAISPSFARTIRGEWQISRFFKTSSKELSPVDGLRLGALSYKLCQNINKDLKNKTRLVHF